MGAEAEPKAEAEPYYGYYGLGYHGLGYRTYGYGHGLYYGKREAELSPRPLLIPTCCTVVTGPTAMATPPTATATEFTTARGRLRPRLTLTTTVDTTAMDSATATATVLATG